MLPRISYWGNVADFSFQEFLYGLRNLHKVILVRQVFVDALQKTLQSTQSSAEQV